MARTNREKLADRLSPPEIIEYRRSIFELNIKAERVAFNGSEKILFKICPGSDHVPVLEEYNDIDGIVTAIREKLMSFKRELA